MARGTAAGLGWHIIKNTGSAYRWHSGVLRGEPVVGHQLRGIRLARRCVHGLWCGWVWLLELGVERSGIDGKVLGCRGGPGWMLGATPSNILRSRLEALRVVPPLLGCFPLAAIGLILGGDRAGPGHTIAIFTICVLIVSLRNGECGVQPTLIGAVRLLNASKDALPSSIVCFLALFSCESRNDG